MPGENSSCGRSWKGENAMEIFDPAGHLTDSALLALARKAAGPYGEDVAAWLAVPADSSDTSAKAAAAALAWLILFRY